MYLVVFIHGSWRSLASIAFTWAGVVPSVKYKSMLLLSIKCLLKPWKPTNENPSNPNMNITADNEIMLGQALGFLLLFVILLYLMRRCDEFRVVKIESYPHPWILIKPYAVKTFSGFLRFGFGWIVVDVLGVC
jgi:hypothetical protein